MKINKALFVILIINLVGISLLGFIQYIKAIYYNIDNYGNEPLEINKDFKLPSDEERIKREGYSFVYSKDKNNWREYNINDSFSPDDILVSKISEGKCFKLYFSSYQHKYLNKNLTLNNVTTFIKNDKLYTFDYSKLKMEKIVKQDNDFKNKELSISEIQKLYPLAKIIKVSDFKNRYLQILQNNPSQIYLLLSNTDYSGYNYGIGGCGFELNRDNNLALFTISSYEAKVVHAFFGNCEDCSDENPCLTMEFVKTTDE